MLQKKRNLGKEEDFERVLMGGGDGIKLNYFVSTSFCVIAFTA